MSKEDKKALDWLPKRKDGRKRYYQCDDDNVRGIYAKGYRKAEKDLELGWEDIELIVNIDKDTDNEESIIGVRKNEEHYQEVLKRFKERKER